MAVVDKEGRVQGELKRGAWDKRSKALHRSGEEDGSEPERRQTSKGKIIERALENRA